MGVTFVDLNIRIRWVARSTAGSATAQQAHSDLSNSLQ
jgi:hypothetical protein